MSFKSRAHDEVVTGAVLTGSVLGSVMADNMEAERAIARVNGQAAELERESAVNMALFGHYRARLLSRGHETVQSNPMLQDGSPIRKRFAALALQQDGRGQPMRVFGAEFARSNSLE